MLAPVSRLLDRFWLRAERALLDQPNEISQRVLTLAERASTAREAAARTSRPPTPFGNPGHAAIAAELYREAIHWALLAHAARRAERPATSAAPASELPRLLAAADRNLLRGAVESDKQLEELLSDLSRSYAEFAELGERAQQRLVGRLERASDALLEPFRSVEERLRRIRARRGVHLGGALALLVATALGVMNFVHAEQRANDLARHATWTASSRAPGGCDSPRQLCAGGENFFFATVEENDPSITFDLGKLRPVSGIEIDNRLDCCTERANLLAVDVSSDGRHWREVARHTKDFTTWRESFHTVSARYVKVHVPAPNSILHLSKVRIYR